MNNEIKIKYVDEYDKLVGLVEEALQILVNFNKENKLTKVEKNLMKACDKFMI